MTTPAKPKKGRGKRFRWPQGQEENFGGMYHLYLIKVESSEEEALRRELHHNRKVVLICGRKGGGEGGFLVLYKSAPGEYSFLVVTRYETFRGDREFRGRMSTTPGVISVEPVVGWW